MNKGARIHSLVSFCQPCLEKRQESRFYTLVHSKIAGLHAMMAQNMSWAPSPDIAYLLSLQAVRDRSQIVLKAAREGRLHNFEYDEKRMTAVADFVISVIEVGSPLVPGNPMLLYIVQFTNITGSATSGQTAFRVSHLMAAGSTSR